MTLLRSVLLPQNACEISLIIKRFTQDFSRISVISWENTRIFIENSHGGVMCRDLYSGKPYFAKPKSVPGENVLRIKAIEVFA